MISLLSSLGRLTVGSFWLPVVAWTVVTGVALWALRRRRSLHPLIRYRMGQALLVALPAMLLTASLVPVGQIPGWTPGAGDGTTAVVDLGVVATAAVAPVVADVLAEEEVGPGASGDPAILPVVAGGATVLALLLAMWNLGLILLRFGGLRRLADRATPVTDAAALSELERLKGLLGVRRGVALLEGPEDSVPITFGWRRPVVVIPVGMARQADRLRMALAHELVHIARADFAWGIGERLVCAAVAFHPLAWVLSRTIDQAREASCDLEVIETREANLHDYAQLLFSLGERARPRYGMAAGLAPSTSHLKERIETMTDLSKAPASPRLWARSVFAAGALLASTTLLGACFSMERNEVRHDDGEAVVAAQPAVYATADQPAVIETVGRPAAWADLELDNPRMEAQVLYLASEIDAVVAQMRGAGEAFERGETSRESYSRLVTRHKILTEMYEERIRMSELMKLEQIAAAATR